MRPFLCPLKGMEIQEAFVKEQSLQEALQLLVLY